MDPNSSNVSKNMQMAAGSPDENERSATKEARHIKKCSTQEFAK